MDLVVYFKSDVKAGDHAYCALETFIKEILDNKVIDDKQRLRSIVARLAMYFHRRVVVFEYDT